MSNQRDSFLVFRVNESLWAIPLAHVGETLRPLPVERTGPAPEFLLGVSVIRGAPVPVIDAAALLSSAPGETPRRLIVVNVGDRRVALAVQSVLGIRTLPRESLHELPPLLQKAGADVAAAIGTLDEKLLVVLHAARFVPESVWESLNAAGAPG